MVSQRISASQYTSVSGVRQTVRVEPGRTYRMSCFVRTEGEGFAGRGALRVVTLDGRVVASATFGDKPEWTRVGSVWRAERNNGWSWRLDSGEPKIGA